MLPQSSELAAGAGFTFENLVAARYLVALLTEQGMPGSAGIVASVALQQRDFGEPLDDVIVDFQSATGECTRLSLQCKSSLIISRAPSNTDFREIIRDSAKTLQKPDFWENLDRFGAAVRSVAAGTFDTLTKLCELARADDTLAHFRARFAPGGNASTEQRAMKDVITILVAETLGADDLEDFLYRFLRHFVIIRFDYLHEGATDSADAINAARPALPNASSAQAPALWAALCQIAREGAARAAQFSRAGLVVTLNKSVRLAGAPSLRDDLAKLSELTSTWVRDIDDDVRGARLAREELAKKLDEALARERLVQLRGLPGSGKSVLLRRRIEADLASGPVLFLKSDRLEGKSWSTFAKAVGLSGVSLTTLLVEVADLGTNVLYIDGIDRIEKQHQGVVADIVRQILNDPLLANWRVVFSLRDAGSEPLRTWLPDLFEKGRLGTIDVGPLSDKEAEALAEAKPELAPLLFGSDAVREIVRRPFFAKILSQALSSAGGDAISVPASEVGLIEIWWSRGGFNATGATATARQRAIVELAANRVRNLSQPLLLADMTATTVAVIDDLVTDSIFQVIRPGHSVRFAHDIFFEWALFHRLVDCRAAWADEIKAAGEPPVIGRVVELLSQSDFDADRGWEQTLRGLEGSGMRSQWARAWLLGPISAPSFDDNRDRYYRICAKDDFRLLGKALVWFQAEKTTPNPAILEGKIGNPNLKRHEIVRLADTLGWPSDFAAWRRLVLLLLDHVNDLPMSLVPDIVVGFEVWQNGLGGIPNKISSRLLTQCATWLTQVETRRHSRRNPGDESGPSPWVGIEADLEGLENSLRSLLLRGARVRPDLVTTYLMDLRADDRRLDKVFKGVALYSPFLVRNHASLLVDISLLHFREELPQARIDQEHERRRRENERRRAARAKPARERTREDEMILAGAFSTLGSSFNSFEWENLAVDKDLGNYFPASPLREPFHSLFQFAPDEALQLVKDLSNHAMTAWRQLHLIDPQRGARLPIPIELRFPWGQQQFWGTAREYLWHRGLWAPKPLAGAYLAMERWAFEQLEARKAPDVVIAEIVKGNQSVAALGIAVSIVLKTTTVSAVTLPLVACQRLWVYDLNRKAQEVSIRSASQIGWRGSVDFSQYEAVKALNDLPVRDLWLRDLVGVFLLGPDKGLAEQTRAAIAAFEADLPYEYQEERSDPDRRATLEEQARFNAEFAKQENVKTAKHPEDAEQEVVYIDNPRAREPKVQEQVARAQTSQQIHLLWFWADKSLKHGAIASEVTPELAVAFAKRIDGSDLFEGGSDDRIEQSMRQGAVAGCAAVIIKYRNQFNPDNVSWAKEVIRRAAATPELSDGMWSSGSVIPWHPCISVAKATGLEIRAHEGAADAKRQLLQLVAHPLDTVALAALNECLSLWDADPRFAWCAFWEAIALCQFTVRPMEAGARVYNPSYVAEKRAVHADEAIAHFNKPDHWPDLPAMPPAWVAVDGGEASIEAGDDNDRDEVDVESSRRWRQPDTVFDWNFAAKVIAEVPVAGVLGNAYSCERFLTFAGNLLGWVLQKIAPPWKKRGRRERSDNLGDLDRQVGNLYARLAVELDTAQMDSIFLSPVFGLEDELCYELLSPFVGFYVCVAVYDTQVMPSNALDILQRCLERILKDRVFDPASYRAGELHGYSLPYIVRSLLFVSAENAGGAVRFANGDWTDIGAVMPIVDRLVRAAGWAWPIMSDFLTLVEHARDVYPVEAFADQELSILAPGRGTLRGWRGTLLPARIASLVQSFAFRETPMRSGVAQKLLRILDILVDMGDRRSAALQTATAFAK